MLKQSMLVFALVSANSLAAVPSQYIAKQYTEALGRAPDQGGWRNAIAAANGTTCNAALLQNFAVNVFSSTEYTSKGYTPEEQVLTLYRAIFSREPDESGLTFFANSIRNGLTAAQIVPHLINSQEFAALVPQICAGKGYRADGAGKQAINIGSGTWTQAQLEACLANNAVCSVPARTVVYLTSTLTIPAGKVLETAGGIPRTSYARQARLVRSFASPGKMLVVMQPGSTVRNIWVSGQRHLYKNALVKVVPPAGMEEDMRQIMYAAQANVHPNINYVGGAGYTGTISNVRSDAPLTATNIATFPVPTPAIPTGASTFAGNAVITDNLATGYAHAHTYAEDGATSSAPVVWTDGISHHLTAGTIARNDIIDPSDVGIVIFGHDDSTQNSSASGNIIVHSGVDAYGSLGLDTTQCFLSYANCKFGTAGGFSDNLILGGPQTHSDIMLFNGTAAWSGTTCAGKGVFSAPYDQCGTGGRMVNNVTGGDTAVAVQIAQQVDGMKNATMSGNVLNTTTLSGYPNLRCLKGSAVIHDRANGHADGNLGNGTDAAAHACIGH